jgi:hypothetical protein
MAGATKPRTQAQALDAIAHEMRMANLVDVLRLGTSALDDTVIGVKTTPETAARQRRLNRVRAEIRAGLGIEEGS